MSDVTILIILPLHLKEPATTTSISLDLNQVYRTNEWHDALRALFHALERPRISCGVSTSDPYEVHMRDINECSATFAAQ